MLARSSRLADELGAQRGEDLGAVLQALLDEGTWSAAELGSENGEARPDAVEPDAGGAGRAGAEASRTRRLPSWRRSSPQLPPTSPHPLPAAVQDIETETEPKGEAAPEPETEPESTNGKPPVVPVPSEPVLEMLAAREGVRGPDGKPGQESADASGAFPT